jgi:hypothetical protein
LLILAFFGSVVVVVVTRDPDLVALHARFLSFIKPETKKYTAILKQMFKIDVSLEVWHNGLFVNRDLQNYQGQHVEKSLNILSRVLFFGLLNI